MLDLQAPAQAWRTGGGGVAGSVTDGFSVALHMLVEEHEEQVAALRAELMDLRWKRDRGQGAAGGGGVAGAGAACKGPGPRAAPEAPREPTCHVPPRPPNPDVIETDPFSSPRSPKTFDEVARELRTKVANRTMTGSAEVSPTITGESSHATRSVQIANTFSRRGRRESPVGRTRSALTSSLPTDLSVDTPSELEAPRFPTLEMIQGQLGMTRISSVSKAANQKKKGARRRYAIESGIGLVILLNTLCLGVQADVHPEWWGWLMVDSIFDAIFLVELLWKVRASGVRQFLLGADRFMNQFEMGLVLLSLFERAVEVVCRVHESETSFLLPLLRIARLLRIFRIWRVTRLQAFSELAAMLRGMVGGLRMLGWSVVLIVLPVYGVSLALRETLGAYPDTGHNTEYFTSLPRAFFSVFRCVVLAECADKTGRPLFVVISDEYGWGFAVLYCSVSVFVSVGLFNVIVAVFVESVVKAAKSKERMERKSRLRNKGYFSRKMAQLLKVVCMLHDEHCGVQIDDRDMQGFLVNLTERATWMEITPAFFEEMRNDPRVQELFDDLDMADEDQYNLFRTLDADASGAIDLEEFSSGIAKLRGDACRSDIVSISFMVQGIRNEVRSTLHSMLRRMYKQQDLMTDFRDSTEFLREISSSPDTC